MCADFRLVPNHISAVTSLDTLGIWNVNMPATKTSTQDTYSALSGLKIFILTKNREEWCKSRTISRGAHRERHLSYVCVC